MGVARCAAPKDSLILVFLSISEETINAPYLRAFFVRLFRDGDLWCPGHGANLVELASDSSIHLATRVPILTGIGRWYTELVDVRARSPAWLFEPEQYAIVHDVEIVSVSVSSNDGQTKLI